MSFLSSSSLHSTTDANAVLKTLPNRRAHHHPHPHHHQVDISTLAQISEGYSSGSIRKAVEETITSRRIVRMAKAPLKEEEFIGALSRQTTTFADDHEKFKNFTAIITGLKETREKIRKAAAASDEKDAASGDAKGKKKATKGKK